MEVNFRTDRVTKNTVRFEENPDEGMLPRMGTVYVNKATLKELGVKDPDQAKTVTLELKKAS